MKRKLTLIAVALLTLFSFSAFTLDDGPFEALLKRLEAFVNNHPQEKVYLHLDKPYYAIGDNIWFKAYVVDVKTSQPSTISNILYVELINEKDSITKQIKLPMQSGITWGDFKLTDTLSEGNYRIRAYTQWMRNESPEFFFDKTIKIGNAWANKIFTKNTSSISGEGKNEQISNFLQFTDQDGKPYAKNEVTYEVRVNNKVISRGKSITSLQGQVEIVFSNNQPTPFKSGEIIATITLANKQKVVKSIPIKNMANAIDVQFFPEGGTLVEGLPCKIGVKAINANGLGQDIKGTIIDNEGNEILKFETTYLGMGSLFLNPLPGKTYTAKIKFANGTERTMPLPKIEKSGYMLSINNTDTSKVLIKVMFTEDLLNKGELKLIAAHNGGVYFTSKIPTAKQIISIVADKKELASGVMQFTLFSSANIPVSERIAFIQNKSDQIQLNLPNVKSAYQKREKVELAFTSTNNGKPTQGSFSVAVTNASIVNPDLDNESNILTRLLLTSDLTGYVEKPNHYFLNDDLKTRTELDNLMLTQGWRKINWKAIAADQQVAIVYQPEKTMRISGRITKGGKPVAKGKVSLFSSSGGFFATDTLSNEKGEFNFDQIDFSDSTKFVVQARTDKNNKNVQIDLDIVPGQVVTANKNTGDIEINVNDALLGYLRESNSYFDEQYKNGFLNKTIVLKEVNVVGKKNPAVNSANLNGAGHADAVITAKDLENAFSLSQFLQGRVAGINIRNGQAFSRGSTSPMSIVLDGMNLGGDFELDNIVVQDIESIEVLKSIGNTAIYGSSGAGGVLVITTKRGGGTSYNRYAPGIVTYLPKGYYMSRQFYSPKYDTTPDTKPDFRSTVYWAPHIVSDVNGKASLNYFNTDQQGTYRVVIEGIDSNGNLARKVITYQVN